MEDKILKDLGLYKGRFLAYFDAAVYDANPERCLYFKDVSNPGFLRANVFLPVEEKGKNISLLIRNPLEEIGVLNETGSLEISDGAYIEFLPLYPGVPAIHLTMGQEESAPKKPKEKKKKNSKKPDNTTRPA